MHELKIAQDLSVIVLDAAGQNKLARVTAVNVIFGKMIQVVPEIFDFVFTECVRGTIASEAKLNIEVVPVIVTCRDCGAETELEEYMFLCSKCGSSSIDIKQGKELYIKSIEGE
jgi:hydrogenase nickel incorporation protein HypA/HybF